MAGHVGWLTTRSQSFTACYSRGFPILEAKRSGPERWAADEEATYQYLLAGAPDWMSPLSCMMGVVVELSHQRQMGASELPRVDSVFLNEESGDTKETHHNRTNCIIIANS